VKTVKKDGTGDYTTVKAACLALAGGVSAFGIRNYVIVIYPGTYDETSILVPSGVTLRGINRDTCTIKGRLAPASLADATIIATSTIDLFESATLENLTITGQNVRYPVHFEGAGTNPDRKVVVRICHIEHFGNQEVRDWRDANPGSGLLASTVWNSWIAWGEGAASGVEVFMENTTLHGRSTFYLHDNRNFPKLTRHILKNCRQIGLDQNGALSVYTVNPIGSGQDNQLIIEGRHPPTELHPGAGFAVVLGSARKSGGEQIPDPHHPRQG
jgi:hypothetical protein